MDDLEGRRSDRIAFYSVAANLVVTCCKAFLAYLTGSSAVLADAIHGVSDLVASLAVWVGIRVSRFSSSGFPFGLYKVENILELITALFILMAGYQVVRHMPHTEYLRHLPLALVVLSLLTGAIYLFVRFEKHWAVRLNSPALTADAEHWKVDILTTVILVLSLLIVSLGLSFMDGVATIVILLFILHAAWRLAKNALKSLLDASVDYTTLDTISKVVLSFPRVKRIKSMAARSSGPCIFAHVEVVLQERDLRRAHDLTEQIEEAVMEAVPHVERVFIHYEPEDRHEVVWAVPLDDGKGNLSSHFGKAPFIGLLHFDPSTKILLEVEVKENPFCTLEKGKGLKLAEYLIETGVDVVVVREPIEDKGPGYLLRGGGVTIRTTQAVHMKELMPQFA